MTDHPRRRSSGSSTSSLYDRRAVWVGAGVLLVALPLYLSTLLTHVPLNADRNLVDVGEIQIALNLWGTLHHTGYPAYTILGSAFTTVYRWLGGDPVTGPSAFSVLWAIGALGLTYALLLAISRHAWGAGIAALFVGVTSAFWINASIAEVYSMYMALLVATLFLARRLAGRWSDQGFTWLAVLLGLAGAHYRLAAFVLPAVAVYVVPSLWRQRRRLWWLLPAAALAGLAAFLPYLYLPVRAWQHAQWVFGSPDTWDGFWRIFIGPTEVTAGPPSVSAAVSGPLRVLRVLIGEASLVGLLGGLTGLIAMAWRREHRRDGLALLALAPAYIGAGVLFPYAAVPNNFLMPVILALGAGTATLLAWLASRRPVWGLLGLVLAATLTVFLGVGTYSTVRAITRPDPGPDLVAWLDATPRAEGEREPAFMLPWGRKYFAAYFARYVSHRISGLDVVDHNTDFAADLAAGRSLYTLPSTFYEFPLSWWERRLGRVYLSAAAPEVVQISDRPIVAVGEVPGQSPKALGDGLALLGARVERQREGPALVFTLYFQAEAVVATDYSVSVRVTGTDSIASGADILAQQDAAHPVFGWYPTSRWRPGEIVRDIYVVSVPAGARPARAEVLLYERLASGGFRNLGSAAIELPLP